MRYMESVKEQIMNALRQFFDEVTKDERIDIKRIMWELDNIIYPHIGSYIASGELTKEEGKEIFEFCEKKLKEIMDKRST